MKRLLLTLAMLALAGCTQTVPPAPGAPTKIGYYHDATHHVACWTFGYGSYSAGISCLPDAQVAQP